MKKIPYKLDVKKMSEKVNYLQEGVKLNLLNTLLIYKRNGIMSVSDLISIGKRCSLDLSEIESWFKECNDEDGLFKLSKSIMELETLGFIPYLDHEDIVLIANERLNEIYRNN